MFRPMTKEDRNWWIYFIEQYSQFLGGCNWYTFNPIFIEFEDDRIMGGVAFTFIILGLGFRWRYNYKETPTMKKIRKSIEEIKNDIKE